jgi:hypothetical protein
LASPRSSRGRSASTEARLAGAACAATGDYSARDRSTRDRRAACRPPLCVGVTRCCRASALRTAGKRSSCSSAVDQADDGQANCWRRRSIVRRRRRDRHTVVGTQRSAHSDQHTVISTQLWPQRISGQLGRSANTPPSETAHRKAPLAPAGRGTRTVGVGWSGGSPSASPIAFPASVGKNKMRTKISGHRNSPTGARANLKLCRATQRGLSDPQIQPTERLPT